MVKANPTIDGIIGYDDLQTMQDNISLASNYALCFTDLSGNFVTRLSAPDHLKSIIENNCLDSIDFTKVINRLCQLCAQTRKPESIFEGNTGFEVAAVPVFIEDSFFGSWIVLFDSLKFQGERGTENFKYAFDPVLNLIMVITDKMIKQIAENRRIAEVNGQLETRATKLEVSMNTFQAFSETVDVAVYVTDFETCEIIMCNNKYAENFDITAKDLIGHCCYTFLGFNSRCPFCPYDKLIGENGEFLPSYEWENYLEPFNMWVKLSNRATRWIDGRIVHVATIVDITKSKELEKEVHLLAFYDKVLNLPNRSSLERDLNKLENDGFLIVLDIVGLRKINDIYGRLSGDLLLSSMRDYFINLNIPNSIIYRIEIADFAILVTKKDENHISAMEIVEKIERRCKESWIISAEEYVQELFISLIISIIPVGGSYGVKISKLSSSIENTLEIARETNGLAIYNNDTEDKLRAKRKLEVSLRNAVRENMNGFYVVYQPIINPGIAMWCGIEALCRWNSPELGPILPMEFIPMAESCGLISTLGIWVLEQSVKQVKEWKLDKLNKFVLEVNISPIQLITQKLDQYIVAILEKYDYPPKCLCLEITESSEMNFSRQTWKAIERLNDIGVILALDDFGTGYASLSILHKLPVQILKTDRSFIKGMEEDPYLQRLFYIMAELAQASDMKIVVEGVETDFQAKFLLKQGVDYFQGNLFSEPLTSKQMREKLDNFYLPLAYLVSMGYEKFDISTFQDDKWETELNPTLYKIVNKCLKELYVNHNGNMAIDKALESIGSSLNTSRTYVFLKNPDGTYSNTHEWCAPGISAEKEQLQAIPVETIYPEWTRALREEGMLVSSDVQTLRPELCEILSIQGIKAVVEFPIWKDGQLYGFVGFDDCESKHYWTTEEIQMLHTLTGIITSSIKRMWLEDEVNNQIHMREVILNHMDTIIYVSDIETNQILFANSETKRWFGDIIINNSICWEMLQKRAEKCEFCPVDILLKHPEESYQWEFFNEFTQRHYRIKDILIPWKNNKIAHLEYAEDITNLKNYQKQLEVYVSTDMLTMSLNRTSFFTELGKLLEMAEEKQLIISVIFIDIDGLKTENDTYGHKAGDKLIADVVQELKGSIRDSDILGRYGGDEFIIAMFKCTHEFAEKRMREALLRFKIATYEQRGPHNLGFSFGIVQNDEISHSNLPDYMNSLVNLADKRMFEQKRKRKR